MDHASGGRPGTWLTRGVAGIVLATFFSDVAHEMVTAVAPVYLATLGLGAAALGVMEGTADLLFSLSKLAGGVVGHHVPRKRGLTALGYGVTGVATAAMALAQSAAALVSLRGAAWVGRGFRSPLRDFLLADEVEPTHFARAYGVERSADMLGAVVGPLLAVALVAAAVPLRSIIAWSVVPAAIPVLSILLLARDRRGLLDSRAAAPARGASARIPRSFWPFLAAVFVFGLGDFSRTFLVLLGSRVFGDGAATVVLPSAVLVYALHNLVSAVAAYPFGHLGDRFPRRALLAFGYGVGAATNGLLAVAWGGAGALVAAVVLSGIYIAAEETLEKAVAAEILPREVRSLGFGILAAANAAGDMASSVYVGLLIDAGRTSLAFGIAATFGAAGFLLLVRIARGARRHATPTRRPDPSGA